MLLSFTVQFLELLFKTFDAFFVWFFLSFFFIKPEVNLFSLFRKSLFAYINPFIRMFIIKSVQDFPMQFILIFIVILYFFFNLIIFFLMFFNENLIKHEIKEFSVKNEICNKIKNASFSSVSNLIINLFDFNMKVFLCNLLKQFFSFFVSSLHNKKNIIWVEYYPAGVYFFEEDRYAIVSFDKIIIILNGSIYR